MNWRDDPGHTAVTLAEVLGALVVAALLAGVGPWLDDEAALVVAYVVWGPK